MDGLLIGLSLASAASWALLVAVWRRSVAIQRTMAEPGLANIELLRLLANSYAAAKLMLDACPGVELSSRCNGSKSRLSLAIAAVDEFNRSYASDDPA